jgi:broad specificity phosphatase PhoE
MTATVHLVRHAAHGDLGKRLTGRAPGIPLTLEGLAQATRVARRLGGRDIAAIHSSPSRRARETATAIARLVGIGVEVAPALAEVDFGDWTGKRFDELYGDAAWERWNSRRSTACPPQGETMTAAQNRAVSHVEHLAAAHRGREVVVVSHCDVIRAVVAHYLGLPLDNLLRFDIDPASVTTLLVGSWGARLTGLNERVAA